MLTSPEAPSSRPLADPVGYMPRTCLTCRCSTSMPVGCGALQVRTQTAGFSPMPAAVRRGTKGDERRREEGQQPVSFSCPLNSALGCDTRVGTEGRRKHRLAEHLPSRAVEDGPTPKYTSPNQPGASHSSLCPTTSGPPRGLDCGDEVRTETACCGRGSEPPLQVEPWASDDSTRTCRVLVGMSLQVGLTMGGRRNCPTRWIRGFIGGTGKSMFVFKVHSG
jgi:hypothetical protein